MEPDTKGDVACSRMGRGRLGWGGVGWDGMGKGAMWGACDGCDLIGGVCWVRIG